MRYPASSRSTTAARQIPDGLDSSSTNIASDQALVNARRSMATTSGRSAYVSRRTSMAAGGGGGGGRGGGGGGGGGGGVGRRTRSAAAVGSISGRGRDGVRLASVIR